MYCRRPSGAEIDPAAPAGAHSPAATVRYRLRGPSAARS